ASALAIDAREVAKTFRSGWLRPRETAALRGATLAVPRGAIVGLLGPNGAGKTTFLSILATLLIPDRGTVRVLGLDVVRDSMALRRRLNMASGRPSFLWSLRVAEIVAFYGRLYGLSGAALRARVDALIEQYELTPYRRVPYSELSTGLKQRVALAKSLVNDPELLFLDEPTLGLDPDVSMRVRAHIAALRRERGVTILLTTHYMREAEELCDEVAFIKAGRILDAGTPDELKRRIGLGDVIALRLEPAVPAWLAEAPGVLRCASADGWTKCTVDDAEKRLPDLLRQLFAEGVTVRNVCQLEVAYAVLMDVWSKSIKHQFLAPIGIRHLTVGSWVVGMVRGSLLFTLLAVLAWWAFDFRVLAAGGGAVGLFLFGCFLNAWIVGVFVCALITLFGNRAEAFAWASVNLVLVLAGIYYPVSVLPEPAATLARAIPLTYFLDAYRSHFGFA